MCILKKVLNGNVFKFNLNVFNVVNIYIYVVGRMVN